MLRYQRVSSDVFMDTFFASVPSMKKNKCVQVFCTDFYYFYVNAMEMKRDVPKAVKRFFKEVGVPPNLICDPAPEQVKGDTRKICEEANCTIRQLEKGTQWANRAEGAVNRFKLDVKKLLKESNAPLVMWDYCLERLCKIFNHTALTLFQLDGITPHTMMIGQLSDISAICEFAWYDWVYFRDGDQQFPHNHERLGRALGPADNAGPGMSQWILTGNGNRPCDDSPLLK